MKTADYSNEIDMDDIGESSFDVKFQAIIEKIAKETELEYIFLKGNGLTEKEIEKLANVLSNHKNLKMLDLSYNDNIHIQAIPALKKIILEHALLESIRLEYNKISDDDVKALIQGNTEQFNERLRTIDVVLASNNITNDGLRAAQGKLSNQSVASICSGNFVENEPMAKPSQIQVQNAPFTPLKDSSSTPPQPRRGCADEVFNVPAVEEFITKSTDEDFEVFLVNLREKRQQNKQERLAEPRR